MEPISISVLSMTIKQTLQRSLPSRFWLWGEINSMSVRGGHCYIDLVEKATGADTIVGRIRCNIWQWNWQKIEEKFRQATGRAIVAGITIQLLVQVEYHEVYSMSVSAWDVDPTYTLGAIQRRRLQIVESLRNRGLLQLNKQRTLPILLRRIAVISSDQAAGYTDFCHQLHNNSYGFAYTIHLYRSIMQGPQTEASMIAALNAVAQRATDYDAVVIIRGGGATSDLYAFDSKVIAEVCASMPLPVLTGIGHQRDESILDMVAHTSLKTPTAVAEFILGRTKSVADHLDSLSNTLARNVKLHLANADAELKNLAVRIPAAIALYIKEQSYVIEKTAQQLSSVVTTRVTSEKSTIANISTRLTASALQPVATQRLYVNNMILSLPRAVEVLIKNRKSHLQLLQTKVDFLDPRRLLQRGYSITTIDGKAVTDASVVAPGAVITTRLAKGGISSTVVEITND